MGVVFSLFIAVGTADAGSVTIAWDPSPTPDITHYRVFVGRVPGVHPEYYDVGPFQTSFVYQAPLDGVSYYFAVAAARGGVIGPKSTEVLAVPTLRALVLESAPTETGPLSRSVTSLHVCQDQARCQAATRAAPRLGEVGAMAATRDGRLLVVEDGRVVRIMDEDGGLSGPVLEVASPDDRFSALAVDPMFAATRTVLVGVTTSAADGRRLTVSRYREFGGTLGDRATVVAGLHLPGEGDAQLAMDAEGFIYVALPAETPGSFLAGGRGSVLRLAPDGTAPRDNPGGMPEFARGPSAPRALLTTGNGEVWVIGAQAEARWPVIGQTNLAASAADRPEAQRASNREEGETVSAAVSSDTTGEARFFTVDAAGALWTYTAGGPSSRVELGLSTVAATQVAAEPGGRVYVAVRPTDMAGSREGSWIVRLITD
jgi:hypothetical protein